MTAIKMKKTEIVPLVKTSRPVDFFEFIFIWMRLQGLTVPRHQRRIAKWLSGLWLQTSDRQGLLMAFRNSGKSTIVGLFCAWVLYRRPQTRILVMAADHALAKKMVRNVKRIIEQHLLTRGRTPDRLDQSASDQSTIRRDQELRDPSMLAKGIGANITGLRADLIICDDVEVPKNCDSALKRQELRARLDELDYILTPEGMQLYIGTPHTYYTIYQTAPDPAKPEIEPYLRGFDSLLLPILDEQGHSAWPERFSEEKIASVRTRSGENKFQSQMMLRPVNIADSRLDPSRLVAYGDEIAVSFANGREILKIGDVKMVSASCWWDPSFAAEGKGDNSVIACVFADESGRYWLHDLEYIRLPARDAENAASLQCLRVAEFLRRNRLPSVRVEANGIGKFLPGILKQTLRAEGLRAAVLEMYSHANKQARILEAFEVLLAEKALHAHRRIWNSGFIEEMREWSPAASVHDDALDAVAGCLLNEPVRLPPCGSITSAAPGWQGASAQYSALSKFEI